MRNRKIDLQQTFITLPLDEVATRGRDLERPECVLSDRSGFVYASNWQGGVTIIPARGAQRHLIAGAAPIDLKPNGICRLADGSFLLANLSDDGGVWRLNTDSRLSPLVTEADGHKLPATNFVVSDGPGKAWITVSTSDTPRARAYRRDVANGYIVRYIKGEAHVVADGLGFANECKVDPSGQWLYVNETFARRLSRYPILGPAKLGRRDTVHEFGTGTFPDGLSFDVLGGVWITSIISNRVIRIDPDGCEQLILEDNDPAWLAEVEAAYQSNTLHRDHLTRKSGRSLASISSLAFGGRDLKTAYLGCLSAPHVYHFKSPVAGCPNEYWSFD
ncbi:MAG: hypothetical protein Hens3KO_13680 [Henriciella sp.]